MVSSPARADDYLNSNVGSRLKKILMGTVGQTVRSSLIFTTRRRNYLKDTHHETYNSGISLCAGALQHGRTCTDGSQVSRQGPSQDGPHGPASPELRQSERQSRRPDHIERNWQLAVRWLVARYFRLQLRESPHLRRATAQASMLRPDPLPAEPGEGARVGLTPRPASATRPQ